ARLTAEQRRWVADYGNSVLIEKVTGEVAHERWGHSLLAERERRVAERLGVEWDASASPLAPLPGVPKETVAAVRGHVTRELSDETSREIAERTLAPPKDSKKARPRVSKKGRKR